MKTMKNKQNDPILKKMPVVILAGGKGAPLGESGKVIPKSMIEINDVPLILYIMDWYAKAGCKKFIICGGYHQELIRDYFRKRNHLRDKTPDLIDRRGWDINVVDTGIDAMTGSRVAQIRPLVNYSDTFFLTYADTVCEVCLQDMLTFHRNHGKHATLLAVHSPTRFRILGLYGDEDIVRGFAEKPILQSDYINGGFYILNRSIFNLKSLKEDRGCVLENEVLEELVAKKELYAFRYAGFWQYVDTERNRQRLCLKFT